MITDKENVARALFSPRMIVDGNIIPAAFELREAIQEQYLSVMLTSIDSWQHEIMLIPQRKNRQLYGYALLNASEIRALKLANVAYDVQPFPTEMIKSHAGITICYQGKQLQGGISIEPLAPGMTQDFLLLAIRSQLTALAQKQVVQIAPQE